MNSVRLSETIICGLPRRSVRRRQPSFDVEQRNLHFTVCPDGPGWLSATWKCIRELHGRFRENVQVQLFKTVERNDQWLTLQDGERAFDLLST